MNTRTITLGDGTLVTITYDSNGNVVSYQSTNPLFVFVVGSGFQLNIGTFTDNVISTLFSIGDLVKLITG